MKILHFILGKANPDRANGVNQVINGLCKYQSLAGNTVYVVGISKAMTKNTEIINREHFQVEVYKSFFFGGFRRLKQLAKEVDVVHLHGVWNHYNIIFGQFLYSINKPYIVTIHSGLTQDRLKQSNYYVKLLYHRFLQKRFYDSAAGIHAITREETTEIARFTKNKNIFFIPNGIDVSKHKLSYKFKNDPIIRIGYLGRLTVEKNIKNLIYAINDLPGHIKTIIELYLIGPIDKKSLIYIKLVEGLELKKSIFFTDALYGEDKINKLRELDFYIHPSYSDVVSMAVMEVMATGIPCVITRTSQVAYYYDPKTFIMVEPTCTDIKRGIIQMIEKKNDWLTMSYNSHRLVEDTFNWELIAEMMIKEYSDVIF